MRAITTVALLILLAASAGTVAVANDACDNVAILGVIPNQYVANSAYVVVKNEGSGIASGISVKISYLNQFGGELAGPTLSVADLYSDETYRLTVFVPTYAASVSAQVVCSQY